MDFEVAKSKTLLYFFEYLMLRGEPINFSHLYGLILKNDFNEDMIEVVGGSLAGLKKLLSEHPSLFTIIDDELVHLNNFESGSNIFNERNYMQETRDYFKHKLIQYGVNVQVPLTSLHGHRSQAPPQIRHQSGIHIADFRKVLSQYPDTFQIIGENVLLLEGGNVENAPSSERSNCYERSENIFTIKQTKQQQCNSNNIINRQCYSFSKDAIVEPADMNGNEPALDFRAVKSFANSKLKLENLCEQNCIKLPNVDGYGRHPTVVRINTQLISTAAESLRVTDKIFESGVRNNEKPVLAFDCKLWRTVDQKDVGATRQITLMALGSPDGNAFLFDVFTCPQIMTDGGLKALLESDRVIKAVHGCAFKSITLYEQYNTILRCVFDTLSGNAILQLQEDGTREYRARNLAFNQMIQMYCPANLVKEPTFTRRWTDRPISEEMQTYVARRVLALAGLYVTMSQSIKEENKPLLSILCTEEILSYLHPKEVKAQRLQRKVNYETADLRQKIAQSNNDLVLSRREIKHLKFMDLTVEEKENIRDTPQMSNNLANVRSFSLCLGTTDKLVDSGLDNPSLENLTLLPNNAVEVTPETSESIKDFVPQTSSTDQCCKCCVRYVEKGSQTLSTGNVVMNRLYANEKS